MGVAFSKYMDMQQVLGQQKYYQKVYTNKPWWITTEVDIPNPEDVQDISNHPVDEEAEEDA